MTVHWTEYELPQRARAELRTILADTIDECAQGIPELPRGLRWAQELHDAAVNRLRAAAVRDAAGALSLLSHDDDE